MHVRAARAGTVFMSVYEACEDTHVYPCGVHCVATCAPCVHLGVSGLKSGISSNPASGHLPEPGPGQRGSRGALDRNHSFASFSLGWSQMKLVFPFLHNAKKCIDFSSLLIVHIRGWFLPIDTQLIRFTAQTYFTGCFPLWEKSPG